MNEKLTKYATSPFVFFQPDFGTIKIIEGNRQTRMVKISSLIYEVLWSFLEQKTLEKALNENLNNEALSACLQEGLILDVLSEDYKSAAAWETNNWSRAAYLMFSQANLKYEEKIGVYDSLGLIDQRRSVMSKYMEEKAYPKRFIPNGNTIINLPKESNYPGIDYESIKNRKSIRGFSEKKVSFTDFSDILFRSTHHTREAELSKTDGDPYFLLNSFYSWLIVYVVVQAVEGLESGVYYFDQENHRLIQVKSGISDSEIHNCIQKQIWIKGGGFCLFIGAQWERYAWIYRHSRAYINLMIQLGEISQEFLINSYGKNLGGWMTPAVTESKANNLCQLKDNSVEMLYFMKFGYPPESKITSNHQSQM